MQKRLRFTKRTLALVLVLVMAVGMLPLMASATDYDDHWSKEFIDDAISRGWMKGYEDGSFRPESSITRAEFAVMLWRAYGEPESENANPFSDVPDGEWYDDATAALFELGITKGVDDGAVARFDPSGTLTREMGMTMLARAFGIEAEDADSYKSFDDAEAVSIWAAAAVSALIEKGYISGVGDNLIAPQNPLKRGEMAKALAVTYDGEGGFPALEGGDKNITITLTYSPTATTSGNVTVTAAVSSANGDVKYIGTRKSSAGATYDSRAGFTDITAASRFTVSENGWYAVFAEDETGAFAYKLINIANIVKGSGGGILPGGVNTPVTGITLDKDAIVLDPNGTHVLTATIAPNNATNQKVTWTIDGDPAVATVDQQGKVTAGIKGGIVTVTATSAESTAENPLVATCKVTVRHAVALAEGGYKISLNKLYEHGSIAYLEVFVTVTEVAGKDVDKVTIDVNGEDIEMLYRGGMQYFKYVMVDASEAAGYLADYATFIVDYEITPVYKTGTELVETDAIARIDPVVVNANGVLIPCVYVHIRADKNPAALTVTASYDDPDEGTIVLPMVYDRADGCFAPAYMEDGEALKAAGTFTITVKEAGFKDQVMTGSF